MQPINCNFTESEKFFFEKRFIFGVESLYPEPVSSTTSAELAELSHDIEEEKEEKEDKKEEIEKFSQKYAVQTLGDSLSRRRAWIEDLGKKLDSKNKEPYLEDLDPENWDIWNNNYWSADEFFDFDRLDSDSDLAKAYVKFKELYTKWQEKAKDLRRAQQNPFGDKDATQAAYLNAENAVKEQLEEMRTAEAKRVNEIENAYVSAITEAWNKYAFPNTMAPSDVINASLPYYTGVRIGYFLENIRPRSIYSSVHDNHSHTVWLRNLNSFLNKFFNDRTTPIASIKDADPDHVTELNEYFAGMSVEEAMASVNNAIYLRNALLLDKEIRDLKEKYVKQLDSGSSLDEKEKEEETESVPEEAVAEEEAPAEQSDFVTTAPVTAAVSPVTETVEEEEVTVEEEAPVEEEVAEEELNMKAFGKKYEKFLTDQFGGSSYMDKLSKIDGFDEALKAVAEFAKTNDFYKEKNLDSFTPQQWFRLIQDSGQSLRVLIPPSIRHKA